jgi:hypothetical protein
VSPTDALVAIPLWAAAGIFVGVIAAKIVRAALKTEDPESPYDL